jgi:hypothetical protein
MVLRIVNKIQAMAAAQTNASYFPLKKFPGNGKGEKCLESR